MASSLASLRRYNLSTMKGIIPSPKSKCEVNGRKTHEKPDSKGLSKISCMIALIFCTGESGCLRGRSPVSPIVQHLILVRYLYCNWRANIDTLLGAEVCSLHQGRSHCVTHPVGADKCLYHYSIIRNNFNVLKIPCVPPFHPSVSSPEPLPTTDLSTVSVVLPFPQRHRVGIVQFIAFPTGYVH